MTDRPSDSTEDMLLSLMLRRWKGEEEEEVGESRQGQAHAKTNGSHTSRKTSIQQSVAILFPFQRRPKILQVCESGILKKTKKPKNDTII